LNADGTLSYGVQFGNDSGNHSETNKGKAVRAMARYDVPTGLSAEVVFLRAERPEHADRTMLQTFGTWRWNGGRLGAQYAWQSRKAAEGTIGPDVDLNVFSAFGVVEMRSEERRVGKECRSRRSPTRGKERTRRNGRGRRVA